MGLAEGKGEPGHSGSSPLPRSEVQELLREVPQWTLQDQAIEREFAFANFREAMGFVGRVAEIAEAQDHHPDIWVSYNRVRLQLTTHKIGGLSRNDFIVAAEVDKLL